MPAMFEVREVADGIASAVLVPAATADRCQRTADDDWHSINTLTLGENVHAVSHFGRHLSQVGAVITLYELPAMNYSIDVVITEIFLVRANALTPEQFAELGSGKTSERIGVNLIEGMGDRRGWFMRVVPIRQNQPTM